ncbi:unnamed protein product [Urochloa humidicola]
MRARSSDGRLAAREGGSRRPRIGARRPRIAQWEKLVRQRSPVPASRRWGGSGATFGGGGRGGRRPPSSREGSWRPPLKLGGRDARSWRRRRRRSELALAGDRADPLSLLSRRWPHLSARGASAGSIPLLGVVSGADPLPPPQAGGGSFGGRGSRPGAPPTRALFSGEWRPCSGGGGAGSSSTSPLSLPAREREVVGRGHERPTPRPPVAESAAYAQNSGRERLRSRRGWDGGCRCS